MSRDPHRALRETLIDNGGSNTLRGSHRRC